MAILSSCSSLPRNKRGQRVRLKSRSARSSYTRLFHEPVEWTPILDTLPGVSALVPHDRQRLGHLVRRFLDHVAFEGCGGLQMTDQVRITIAAEACLLALNLPEGCFGPLKTVLVYPSAFVPKRFSWVAGAAAPAPHAALGESWDRGTVILAWDDVLRGVADPGDGQNVILHEFAHQLDSAAFLSGRASCIVSIPSCSLSCNATIGRIPVCDTRLETRSRHRALPSNPRSCRRTNCELAT